MQTASSDMATPKRRHIIAVAGIIILVILIVASPHAIREDTQSVPQTRELFAINSQSSDQVVMTELEEIEDKVDWVGLFTFVPNGITKCQQLFEGRKYLREPFYSEYNRFIKETKKYLDIEGNSALRIEQYLAYTKIAESPFIKTVCETGFNAGHSTLAWLANNPRTHVYSFDLGIHDYARPQMEYLQRVFPGRLNVTWGDSTLTLPEFHRKNPSVKCDLLIVDGGHTYPIAQSDFDIFRRMSNKENLVVLDNYPDTRMNWMEDLGNVWERAKQRGEMSEIFACSYLPEEPHGFSVGRYLL